MTTDPTARGAPERIWLQDAGDYSRARAAGDDLTWCDQPVDEGDSPYILATPEALAASPEVQALIREAEARCRVHGMERTASELHQMAMMVPDYESNKILENRAHAIRAEAAALRKGE